MIYFLVLVAVAVVVLLVIGICVSQPDKENGPMPKRYGGFGSSITGSAGS